MRLIPSLLAAASLVPAAAALAQAPPPPPPATAQALQGGLFGEPEPQAGEEAVESGAALPPSPGDYDARRRQAFAAAQAFRGPLDGGWTLTAENAGAILDLRFVDAKGKLEGVWRDRRRRGPAASGIIGKITRQGDRLTLEFATSPGAEDFLSLSKAPDGWTGELTENGKTVPVWLSKTSP